MIILGCFGGTTILGNPQIEMNISKNVWVATTQLLHVDSSKPSWTPRNNTGKGGKKQLMMYTVLNPWSCCDFLYSFGGQILNQGNGFWISKNPNIPLGWKYALKQKRNWKTDHLKMYLLKTNVIFQPAMLVNSFFPPWFWGLMKTSIPSSSFQISIPRNLSMHINGCSSICLLRFNSTSNSCFFRSFYSDLLVWLEKHPNIFLPNCWWKLVIDNSRIR